MRRSSLLLSAVVFALFAASTVSAQQMRNDMLVSTEWLGSHWNSVVLLDVSERADFVAGHIPTAIALDARRIVTQRDGIPNELPPVAELEELFTSVGAGGRKRVVLYARELTLATRAWFTLDYLGHGNRVSILDGGLAKWEAEGRRVTKETMPVPRRAFVAVVNPGAVTRLSQMRHLVQWRDILRPSVALIDARASEEYSGRIPGSINVAWSENVSSDGLQTLLAADVLREMYARAGVSPASANIVYCRTGTHATVTYFVLRLLGYGVSMYDGSYVEWSSAENTVIG